MSKGSNPTNVTTTSSSEPSEFIRPYYQQAVDAAQDLYENPNIPSFFPNNTFIRSSVVNTQGLPIWIMIKGARREFKNYNVYKSFNLNIRN